MKRMVAVCLAACVLVVSRPSAQPPPGPYFPERSDWMKKEPGQVGMSAGQVSKVAAA